MREALTSPRIRKGSACLKVIGGGLAFLSLELQAVRRSGPIVMQAPPSGITMEVAPWPPSGLSASLPFAVGPSSCQVDCREHFSSAFLPSIGEARAEWWGGRGSEGGRRKARGLLSVRGVGSASHPPLAPQPGRPSDFNPRSWV